MKKARWIEKTFRKKAPLRHAVLNRYFALANVLEIPSAFAKSARQLHDEAGVPFISQISGLLDAVFRCGLRGREYYLYRFDQITDKDCRQSFVSQRRFLQWLGLLNDWLRDEACWDKKSFHSFCESHHLPTPPILAIFENGAKEILADSPLNQEGLVIFCKPNNGSCGKGIERWKYSNGSFIRQGRELRPSEFDSYLQQKSMDDSYLLQPRIENHPEVAKLSNGSLATVRFNTFLHQEGVAGEFWPVLRMPCGESIVDNFQADNLVAPVDLQTGRLGRASMRKNGIIVEIEAHPDTGCEINGIALPFWDETRSLCRRAQECCEKEHFVGWDVALTADGPVLVEANASSGIEAMQVAHRQGIESAPVFPIMESLMQAMAEDY